MVQLQLLDARLTAELPEIAKDNLSVENMRPINLCRVSKLACKTSVSPHQRIHCYPDPTSPTVSVCGWT